jgi:hypothetical protein
MLIPSSIEKRSIPGSLRSQVILTSVLLLINFVCCHKYLFGVLLPSVNSTKFVILREKSTKFLQQKIGKKPS